MLKTSLDSYDIRILQALQIDNSQSLGELAEQVRLSPSQCSRRISRLKSSGYIQRQVTILDATALGLDVEAFVIVTLEKHDDEITQSFQKAIAELTPIIECHAITGDGDYLLKIIASNRHALNEFLMNQLMKLKGVSHIKTTLALSSIKSTTALPLTT